MPNLDTKERTALYSGLDEGAVCDFDFLLMMCLSTAIAVLDLFVGLFAGAAAAFATARPKVTAALVGVAVAAALVPPIATVGLALTEGNMLVAEGASLLFITNLVSIVIGAAAIFYLMGIQGLYKNMRSPLILRRVLLSKLLGLGLICAPLGYQRADRGVYFFFDGKSIGRSLLCVN